MDNLQQIKDIILQNQVYKIVFYGDSLTSAEWVHPNFREIIEYILKVELAKQITDWKIPSWNLRCINSGLDGATTENLMLRINEYVLSYNPNLVILSAGINDLCLWKTMEDYKHHIMEILKIVREHRIFSVFATSPGCLDTRLNNDFKKYVDLSNKELSHLPDLYIDLYSLYQETPYEQFYTFISKGNPEVGIEPGAIDFLHPNPLGNAYIAGILLKQIFNISFDPELYIKEINQGQMYPRY